MFVLLSAISHKVGTGYSSYFQYITKYYFRIGKPKTYSDQAYNLDSCKEQQGTPYMHKKCDTTMWAKCHGFRTAAREDWGEVNTVLNVHRNHQAY